MNKIKPSDLKGFNEIQHRPYTEYAKDIADWLSDNAYVANNFTMNPKYIFSTQDEFYCHNILLPYDIHYTNEAFKEWIGMNKKPTDQSFTKSDLKDGMVCISKNGNVYIVRGHKLERGEGYYLALDSLNDDLTVSNDFGEDVSELDIIEVLQTTTLFKRVDKKKLAIQNELELAKAKAERLANHISVLESKLK